MAGRTSGHRISIPTLSILALLLSAPPAWSGDLPPMAPPPGQGNVGGGAPRDTKPLPDQIGGSSRGGQGSGDALPDPDIRGVSPSGCFRAGDSATLKGKNFGETRGDFGLVLFAPGGKIAVRSYGKWSDREISFDIPPGVPEGRTAPVVLGDGKREYDSATLSFCAAEGGLQQADLGKSGPVAGAKAHRGDAAALKSRMQPKSTARLLVPGKGEGTAVRKEPVPAVAQKNGSGGKSFGTKAAGLKPPEAGGLNREHPVREEIAARRLSIAALPPAGAKLDSAPGKPNLVGEVEARNGVHTFNGTFIPVKVTNRGDGPSTKPTSVGIRRHGVVSFGGAHWIARRPTGPLDPGESVTVEVPWEEEITDTLYVAAVDIGDSIDEGSAGREGDNDSRPFKVHLFEMVKITMPLTLRQPEGGTCFRGGLLTVEWETFGLAEDLPLRIGLYRGGSRVRDIALPENPLQNWTTWKIPKNFDKGTYRARVQTENGAYSAESPSFEIADGAIEVQKPDTGSSWFAGNTYDVLWEADIYKWPDHVEQAAAFEASREANLSLVSAGQALSIITPLGRIADFRKGRFSWPIPASAAPGSYRITVASMDGLFFGESETFEIVPPDAPLYESYNIFEVDTPGDEYGWTTGSTRTVRWRISPLKLQSGTFDFSQASSRVDIALLGGKGAIAAEIATGTEYRIEGSLKSVEWVVPADLANGLYRLQVKTTDGVFFGQSDPFNIFTAKVIETPMAALPQTAGATAAGLDKVPSTKFFPPDGELLDLYVTVKDMVLRNEFSLDHGSYGKKGFVGEIDVVLEVEANRPFTFGDPWNPASDNPAESWSLADLDLTVAGWVTAAPYTMEICTWSDCREMNNDPAGLMSYRKTYKPGRQMSHVPEIIPVGKSTVTLTVKESHYFHGVDVVGRVKGTDEKCIKHFYPEIGVEARLTVRSPKVSTEGYGSLDFRQTAFEPLSKIFQSPKTVMFVDTFLTGSDLGFQPHWREPVVFSWDGDFEKKCDRPYRGELVGGP